jgi:hypothetical protein
MNGIGMVWVFGSIALLAILLWPVSARSTEPGPS